MSDEEEWLDACQRRLAFVMEEGDIRDIEEAEEEVEEAQRMYRLSKSVSAPKEEQK